MLKKLSLILPILPKLGYRNVTYMVWYRLSLKLGLRKRKFPLGSPITGTFFKATSTIENYPESWRITTLERANKILEGKITWFHYHCFQVGNPPNWFQNPFEGSILNNPNKHWTELSDFDLNTGDIKILWEPSRFDWLTHLARAYRVTGEKKYLETINEWLQDWSKNNPKNQGPNWKCGQETGIRVMKLITTSQILDQDKTALPGLKEMIVEHLERVDGNINYALAQDNNHGTSEAAALYIGAVWLLQQPLPLETAPIIKWRDKGRRLLENRILKLIAPQGSFAQRSVTYHRVVLDTMSWVLYAMERYNEREFAMKIKDRLQKLGEWQFKMIASSHTGEVPNIGSNDGAMFEMLHNADYRDFRPSTQLFFGVLHKQRVFEDKDSDEPLFWRYPETYNAFPYKTIQQQLVEELDQEMVILNDDRLRLFLKLPNDRYRFATCDAFHLDIWYNGKNLFCDSGSYSYNARAETDRFKSVTMHNTVQFDSHEQMPKISRFLYGKWLHVTDIKGPEENNGIWYWSGSYKDYHKNKHRRTLEWDQKEKQLVVIDDCYSPKGEPKTLYWHSGDTLESVNNFHVTDANGTTLIPQIATTGCSLYYMQQSEKRTSAYRTTTNQLKTTIQF